MDEDKIDTTDLENIADSKQDQSKSDHK